MNRRRFLETSAMGVALQGLARGQKSPNSTIQVGIVGIGGRGTELQKECIEYGSTYNARLTAVCDIWKERQDAAAKRVRESYGSEPRIFPRIEDMLADPAIDAVIIGTPDHTHAGMLKAAVEAGKDVYCEKPMGNVLAETNAAMDAVRKSGRIVQIGTQRRAYPKYRSAARILEEGRLGQIVKVDVIWNIYSPYRWARKQEDLAKLKESDVNWKEFLRGKPYRPFDAKIYRSFRLFREFSSGIIDQWMTHGIDVVHMMTGEQYPMSVIAEGGIYTWKDYRENPDTMQAVLQYGHGGRRFLATYATCLANGAGRATRVQGTLGTMWLEDEWRISGEGSEDSRKLQKPEEIPDAPGTLHHMANWLDCVRRRDPAGLYCPASAGYGHSVACIMTTDSLWSGRRMVFDSSRREIRAA